MEAIVIVVLLVVAILLLNRQRRNMRQAMKEYYENHPDNIDGCVRYYDED